MSRFHRPTAYHEAGHVVGHCKLWFGIHDAYVLRHRNGVLLDCIGDPETGGETHGCGQFDAHHRYPISSIPVETAEQVRHWAVVRMVISILGPLAEARYRRTSGAHMMLCGGKGDMENFGAIADWLAEGSESIRRDVRREAETRAVKFLRQNWGGVVAVAERLADVGLIRGDDPVLDGIDCPSASTLTSLCECETVADAFEHSFSPLGCILQHGLRTSR